MITKWKTHLCIKYSLPLLLTAAYILHLQKNMQSMDKLLDLSAVTLEKSDDVIGIAARNVSLASWKLFCT